MGACRRWVPCSRHATAKAPTSPLVTLLRGPTLSVPTCIRPVGGATITWGMRMSVQSPVSVPSAARRRCPSRTSGRISRCMMALSASRPGLCGSPSTGMCTPCTTTSRVEPARSMAARMARTLSSSSVGRARLVIPIAVTTASAPAITRSSASVSSNRPRTTVSDGWAGSAEGSRTSAHTSCPRSNARFRTAPPVLPVAPRMATRIASSSIGRRR